jgi:mono/diheme cytochrome c family protein
MMKRFEILRLIVLVGGFFFMIQMQSCKHDPITLVGSDNTSFTQTDINLNVTDGSTLYANNCASCHGILASSAKLGSTALQIQNGISTVSGMHSLSTLTSAQIQSIADILKTTTPGPVITDGATLYANNCASCHGSLSNSQVKRSSTSEIQQAIKNKSKMKFLSTLSTTQIQAIAGALGGK